MKKGYMKRILSLILIFLLLQPVGYGLEARPTLKKEEIIYGKLDFQGNSDLLIAVNGFPKGFKGEDYGDFSEVVNLSTPENLIYDQGKVLIDAKENFYYQGKLKTKQLPWLISMAWRLDGQPVSEEELLGKSGHLTLLYEIKPNPAVDSKYYDYFVVQSGFQFHVDQITNLVAPEGTLAAAGSIKMVNFMSLPGRGGTYTLEVDVQNYEPGMIQIAALPLNLALDLSDISDYTGELKTLEMAIRQLNGGTWEFLDGLYQVKEGVQAFKEGGGELLGGSEELSGGLFELRDGSLQIREGLGEYSQGMSAFEEGILLLTGGLDAFSEGIGKLEEGSKAFSEGMDVYAQGVEDFSGGLHQVSEASQGLVRGVEALGEGLHQLVIAGKGEPGHVDDITQDPTTLIDASSRFKQAFELLRLLEGIEITPEQAQVIVDSLDFLSNRLIPLLLEIDEAKLDEISTQLSQSLLDLRNSIAVLEGVRQNLLSPPSYFPGEEEDPELVARLAQHYEDFMRGEADKLGDEIERLQAIEGGLSLQRDLLDLFKSNFSALKSSFLAFQEFLGEIKNLLDEMDLTADKLLELNENLKKLSEGYALFHQGLVDYVDGVEAVYLGVAGEGESLLYGTKALSEGLGSLDEGGAALSAGGKELAGGAKEIHGGLYRLREGVLQFSGAKGELEDGVKELSEGARLFYTNYLEFHDGLSQIAMGLGDFTGGLREYVHGFWSLHQGLEDLYNGGLELGRGTSRMAEETKDMDKKMVEGIQEQIEDFSAGGKNFESFLSPKNKDISSVQFVLLYEGKNLPQEKGDEGIQEEKTFWDRFIDLFKNL